MVIGAKNNHNHYLILCFLHQFKKNQFEENKLIFYTLSNLISYLKKIKYEIISLTFGPSKIV
jgi:hypothetical protein